MALTKICYEYNDKADATITAHLVDHLDGEDNKVEEDWTHDACSHFDSTNPNSPHEPDHQILCAQVEFDASVTMPKDIFTWYALAVRLIAPTPLFAMVTGWFSETFAGVNISLMVDTSSELNLIFHRCYNLISLPIDLDGTRWSLKGIHGCPVPLGGYVYDTPSMIGGHDFSHHFFVSEGGVRNDHQDIILEQPWLQWYVVCLSYTHEGVMKMQV